MEGYYTEDELKEFGFKSIGKNVLISKKASVYMPSHMVIGNNVRIDDFCMIVGDITLENYIHIAPYASIHGTGGGTVHIMSYSAVGAYSTIYSGSNEINSGALVGNVPSEYVKIKYSDIVIEKHATIGVRSVILPGTYIAEGVALAPMSLISKKTKPWSVYFGAPARRVGLRDNSGLELEKKLENIDNRG